jgi:hypothetical protein
VMRSLHSVQWLHLFWSAVCSLEIRERYPRLAKAQQSLENALKSACLTQLGLVLKVLQRALRLGTGSRQQQPGELI